MARDTLVGRIAVSIYRIAKYSAYYSYVFCVCPLFGVSRWFLDYGFDHVNLRIHLWVWSLGF